MKILSKLFRNKEKEKIIEQLHFARNVAKRLDEHREVVESIRDHTDLFKTHEWHIWHMATQDDYLMRLFYICYGFYPEVGLDPRNGQSVRKRPEILGECGLPEFKNKETR
ncbi:hypothetical protein [Gilliamella sp. BG6]|uniref:hypothetical protein n=1 Tax=unclassified Gilliamella TaxID=2685620 RepID=UPI003987A7CC